MLASLLPLALFLVLLFWLVYALAPIACDLFSNARRATRTPGAPPHDRRGSQGAEADE